MQRLAVGLVSLALACASGGGAPPAAGGPAGEAGLWGYVRLVPREGVEPGHGNGGSYGDRRLAGVAFVDYERPGFAVVYAEGPAAPSDRAELVLREGVSAPRIEPELAAVGSAGRVAVRNATASPHTLSAPGLGLVRRLAPGERVELAAPGPGEQRLFLLDAPRATARVFVAPGPYAVTSESGRFELGPLAPGRVRLVAWHPRFAPVASWVDVGTDARRVDLELGVGRGMEAP